MKPLSSKQQKVITGIFQQGNRAIQLGLFNEAEEHFLNILKLKADIAEAQAALAYVYTANKQHTKATTQLKALLKSNPNHAQTHHNLANSFYEQELYKEAITHYQAAINTNPKLVESYIHCGIACRMIKDHATAIKYLCRALDLDKTNARAFYILGRVYEDTANYANALHCLESAVELAPEHAEFRISFASILEKVDLDFEANLAYHKACEIDSNYLDGFTLYANFLLKNNRHNKASEYLMHARQLDPSDLNVLDQLGKAYAGINNTDAAITQYKTALLKEPKRLSSLFGLVEIYQQLGNSTKSIAICNEIIDVDSNLPNAYVLKTRIKKSVPEDGMVNELLRLTIRDDIDDTNKALTFFALGKTYDDHKNYPEAFKAYAAGNAIQNKSLNYNKDSSEDAITNLIKVFNKDYLNEHQHLGTKSNLPIIIIGMPRSGTSLTEQIIASHHDILGAGEALFWAKAHTTMPMRLGLESTYPECISEMTAKQAQDIASKYESSLHNIFGSKASPKHIIDKLPHNFLNLGLITLLFPNAKIVHTRRNPIDTCLSIFFQHFNSGHTYAADLSNLGHQYKQYERIMQHWHEVLPNKIFDINYEDTISDPEFWSRKLIGHIGLDWDVACMSPHNLERSVKTASDWQVRQPIYKTSVQRWKNYETFLEPLLIALKN